MSYQDFIDANKQMSKDIDALLCVVRAAKKVSGYPDFADDDGIWDELKQALEALPEHLRTVDKR